MIGIIERLISTLASLFTIGSVLKRNPTTMFRVTEAGGIPIQPNDKVITLNKREVLRFENVAWGEIGNAVIIMKNGDHVHVLETVETLNKLVK